MNCEKKEKLQYYLREAAKLLFENTPIDQRQDFDSIEMSIRTHLHDTVGPEVASFFLPNQQERRREKPER